MPYEMPYQVCQHGNIDPCVYCLQADNATLRAEVERLTNANRVLTESVNDLDVKLTDEMKEVERVREQLAAVTRDREADALLMRSKLFDKSQVMRERDVALSRIATLEARVQTLLAAGDDMAADNPDRVAPRQWRAVRGAKP